MTREEIIQLAQETIFTLPNEDPWDFTFKTVEQRQHFAALIAKAERHRICNMLLDMHAKEERHNYYGFIARMIKESE